MARIIQGSPEVVKLKLESPSVTVIFLISDAINGQSLMPDDEARRLLAVATALPLAELERLERLDRIDQLRRAMGITVSELVELAREVKKRAR